MKKTQMELLDYFAGKALSGIYSDPEIHEDDVALKHFAEICYRQAFAMLEEREKYTLEDL